MDLIQLAEADLGALHPIDIASLSAGQETGPLAKLAAFAAINIHGNYTLFACKLEDGSFDPDRVVLDANGVMMYINNNKPAIHWKFPSNSSTYVKLVAELAKFNIDNNWGVATQQGIPFFPIATCASSSIHLHPDTHDFFPDDESVENFVNENPGRLIEVYSQSTLTEEIFNATRRLIGDVRFRVIGSHFKLNRFQKIYHVGFSEGFPRDVYSDEVLDSAAPTTGRFLRGRRNVYRHVERIARNIVVDEGESSARLRSSLTALLAIFCFHREVESSINYTNERERSICKGYVYGKDNFASGGRQELLVQTKELSVLLDEHFNLVIQLDGPDKKLNGMLRNILQRPPLYDELSDAPDPDVKFSSDFLFSFREGIGFESELQNATINTAVLWAKRGSLRRAQAHLVVVALRQRQSKICAHIVESSITELYNYSQLDELVETAADSLEESDENVGHWALSSDHAHSVSHRYRVGAITIVPRYMEQIGVEHANRRTLRHKENRAYAMVLRIEENNDSGRRLMIKGRLKTPRSAMVGVIKSLTGISVLGLQFSRVGNVEIYELNQDSVAYSLLQGHFGREGFDWILGAILSNNVHVDRNSRAISFLPTSSLRFAEGGLLLNEPLQNSGVRWLKCATNMEEVVVDWGPLHNLVRLYRVSRYEITIKGEEKSRELLHRRGGEFRRCALSRRHWVM